ncbi:MAG: hypothetical protein VYE22_07205 [Myxococcota bacterium]|nr:hypothetical protein [Myxococcota bacterium]
MIQRTLMVFLAIGAVGCASAHPSDEVAPGIYELSASADSDACSPLRAIGAMGEVAVLVEGGAVDAPVPDTDAPLLVAPRVRLSPSQSYHAETNRRVPGCEAAWVHEEWTMLEGGADGFRVLHTQEWQGLADCAAARDAMPGAPDGDCRAERVLDYALQSACHAPCRLVLGEADSVACSCS